MTHENSPQDREMQIAAGKRLLKWVLIIGGIFVFGIYLVAIYTMISPNNNFDYAALELQDKLIFYSIIIVMAIVILPPVALAYPVFIGGKTIRIILLVYLYIFAVYTISFFVSKLINYNKNDLFLSDLLGVILYPAYIYFIQFNKNIKLYLSSKHNEKPVLSNSIDEIGAE